MPQLLVLSQLILFGNSIQDHGGKAIVQAAVDVQRHYPGLMRNVVLWGELLFPLSW